MKLDSIYQCFRHPAITALGGGLLLATAAAQNEPVLLPAPPQSANPMPAPAATAKQEDKPDAVAARYLTSCSGCHTLTDVKLTGPGLATPMKWPDEQLKTAVKRMQEKVGPLRDEDVNALTAFIKDANAPKRIAAEQEKMQARLLAKMDPPDAALGDDLFTGKKGFKNGGLACAACHAVSGEGGNLGLDLTGIFKKMGGKPPPRSMSKTASSSGNSRRLTIRLSTRPFRPTNRPAAPAVPPYLSGIELARPCDSNEVVC